MQNLIGREPEIRTLQESLTSPQAELIAVYGRRRVGKTFLIRNVYEKETAFEMTGIKDATLSGQLENFLDTLTASFNPTLPLATPQNWMQAFRMLINFLESRAVRTSKSVVFLDEFPWLDTPKSGFLAAFDHFWNNWASRQSNLVIVICGSAASWMIKNIVRNKGGLHNRLTRRIRLLPFNLYETEQYLQSLRIRLDRYSILQLYMITGGIPQYLKDVRPVESVAQIIDRLCFANEGWLRNEFKDLYHALFDNANRHVSVIRGLASKPSGMTRTEIIENTGLTSGGSFTKILEELLESGFITEYIPFDKTAKDSIFKLSDEYSLFYLKFIENSKASGEGSWLTKASGASWSSWSGLAFENICLKHTPQIKKALGISGIYTEQSVWRYRPKNGEDQGTQIDLLIDRKDNCINLVEIKFYATEFEISKKHADELQQKRQIFVEKTGTRKAVFLTMLTTFGTKTNEHYLSLIQNQLKMGILFERV